MKKRCSVIILCLAFLIVSNSVVYSKGSIPTSYYVSLSRDTVRAGDTLTVTAQLLDEFGEVLNLPNRAVVWSKGNVSGTFFTDTSLTNSDGKAEVIFTAGTLAGQIDSITATDTDGISGTSSYLLTVNTFLISASSGTGGMITPSGITEVFEGGSIRFDVAASVGYHVVRILVDAIPVDSISGYTFLNLNENHSIAAEFERNQYVLTISISGQGNVIKNPSLSTYYYSDSVILTALPDSGWSFGGFSGDIVNDTVVMTNDKSISALFLQNEYVLTVLTIGNGSITRIPNQATYHYGDTVVLAVTPDAGWSFSGYNGNIVGDTVIIKGDITITALFTRNEYSITTDIIGSGTIIQNPALITYHFGDTVEVLAVPQPGFHFVRWTGDTLSSSNRLLMNITSDLYLRAEFEIDSFTISTSFLGSGSILPGGVQTLPYATTLRYSFIPSPGFHVDTVMVDGSPVDSVSGFTFDSINANHTLYVRFSPNPVEYFSVEQQGGGDIGQHVAGSPFSIRITAKDANNDIVTAFSGAVFLTSDGLFSSGGGVTPSFTGGMLDSYSITMTKAGWFTLTVTMEGGDETGESNIFQITHATLSNFLIQGNSGGPITGKYVYERFPIIITARDNYQNTVTSFSGANHSVIITGTAAMSEGFGETKPFGSGILIDTLAFISAGNVSFSVRNRNGIESGFSNVFTIKNPVPRLDTLSTSVIEIWGMPLTDTLFGGNFVQTSFVVYNGSPRSTEFISDSVLIVNFLPSDIEATGTHQLRVFNPPPGGGLSNPTSFIVKPQPRPFITISDTTVIEGNQGVSSLIFTVKLSKPTTENVICEYRTFDSTASAVDGDYIGGSGTLLFTPGMTNQYISVIVNGDVKKEQVELLKLVLLTVNNADVADSIGIGMIEDNDSIPVVSIIDTTVNEGNSGLTTTQVHVVLTNPSQDTIRVSYRMISQTATLDDSDFVYQEGNIVFLPGIADKYIENVAVRGDIKKEANETFQIIITSVQNATYHDSSGICTIINDDGVPYLSINDVQNVEGNAGITSFIFTITLSAASDDTVSVDYVTDGITAISGSDFIPQAGKLVFYPHQLLSQSITIDVLADSIAEPSEQFTVNLLNPVNGYVSDVQGVATITNDDALPAITIDDVSVAEGNDGIATARFNVTLSQASNNLVTVTYRTLDSSAVAQQGDYGELSGVLVFAPGQTVQTINVNVNGDHAFEGNEVFHLSLSNANHAVLQESSGVATIIDDDPVPSMSINDYANTEGQSGTRDMKFYLSLSNRSKFPITVSYFTTEMTAKLDRDVANQSGTVTFEPDSTVKWISIPIYGDSITETDEQFAVTLRKVDPGQYILSDSMGIGTIFNDDVLPGVFVNDAVIAEGDSGISLMILHVTLSNPSELPVAVHYFTIDGTAHTSDDYNTVNGLLIFDSLKTQRTVSIPITGDHYVEQDEVFYLNISNPENSIISDAQGTVTIINDDGAEPEVSVSNLFVYEGDFGNRRVEFEVKLSKPSQSVVTVQFTTEDSTAQANGNDYQSLSGSIMFPKGDTLQLIVIPVYGDNIYEQNEIFKIRLHNSVNAILTSPAASCLIINDDSLPKVSIDSISVIEGQSGIVKAIFTIRLSHPSQETTSVTYETINGTALDGSDYARMSPSVISFMPGSTSKQITVSIYGDLNKEPDEEFYVDLFSPEMATIEHSRGVAMIRNDDGVPGITINNAEVSESTPTHSSAQFIISLSSRSTEPVSVHVRTSDGSAKISDYDYEEKVETISFSPGDSVVEFTVAVLDDNVYEGDEQFRVLLDSAKNGFIADGDGIGIINDNDTIPAISIKGGSAEEGNSGFTNALFEITLSGPSQAPVTVNYITDSVLPAREGIDYLANKGLIIFPPTTTSQIVQIPVIGDNIDEPDEYFSVALIDAKNAFFKESTAVWQIMDDDSIPILNIHNISMSEPSYGDTSFAIFPVELSNPSQYRNTIRYKTKSGTADSIDYRDVSGTIAFEPSQIQNTIAIPVFGDTISEQSEIFFVVLSQDTSADTHHYTLLNDTVTCTIRDDDGVPGLSITDIVLAESTNAQNSIITISLTRPSSSKIRVRLKSVDGTASILNNDYGYLDTVLIIENGETNKKCSIRITNDSVVENNEYFSIKLLEVSAGIILDDEAKVTILNDDTDPVVSIESASITEGDGQSSVMNFRLTLNKQSDFPVTVGYRTSGVGTITGGVDYLPVEGSLVFIPGDTVMRLPVTIFGDVVWEPSETLNVTLTSSQNGIVHGMLNKAFGVIIDNEHIPMLTMKNIQVYEGNDGASDAVFTLQLDRPCQTENRVYFRTKSATAIDGEDYVQATGSVTFPPYVTLKTVAIEVIGDGKKEHDEVMQLFLDSLLGVGSVSDTLAQCIILNDDGVPTIMITDTKVLEGNENSTQAELKISLSLPTDDTVVVHYHTELFTASVSDIDTVSGKVVIMPGRQDATITIMVKGDLVYEGNENFGVVLTDVSNGIVSKELGLCTILDNEMIPSLSIMDTVINEGNNDLTVMHVTVTLSHRTEKVVTVNYETEDSTALAASDDYRKSSGQLVFSSLDTLQKIVVYVKGDTREEADEVFKVRLWGAMNAQIGRASSHGTIKNDDITKKPVIRSIYPQIIHVGTDGARVTIIGNDFSNDGIILVNGLQYVPDQNTIQSDTQRICWLMPDVFTQADSLTVKVINNPDSTSNAVQLYVLNTMRPGDTDNDGEVSSSDLIPIALCYEDTVPKRNNFSRFYREIMYEQYLPPGENQECLRADCDGNGIIGDSDIRVILENWNRTEWGETAPSASASQAEQIDAVNSLISATKLLPDNSARSKLLSVLYAFKQTIFPGPEEWELRQNFPNPFNGVTAIQYVVPLGSAGDVVIAIYNILGQKIISFIKHHSTPGYYTVTWEGVTGNGNAVPSGVYYYTIDNVPNCPMKKMLYLR